MQKSEISYLIPGTPQTGQKVQVYQYRRTNASQKQYVSFGFIKAVLEQTILYEVESKSVSSGSPIINENGMVVGIHSAAPSDSSVADSLVGIRIDYILESFNKFITYEFSIILRNFTVEISLHW